MPHYLDPLRSSTFRSLLTDHFGQWKLLDISDESLFDTLERIIDSDMQKNKEDNVIREDLYKIGFNYDSVEKIIELIKNRPVVLAVPEPELINV